MPTMRYLHPKRRAGHARLLSAAFEVSGRRAPGDIRPDWGTVGRRQIVTALVAASSPKSL